MEENAANVKHVKPVFRIIKNGEELVNPVKEDDKSPASNNLPHNNNYNNKDKRWTKDEHLLFIEGMDVVSHSV